MKKNEQQLVAVHVVHGDLTHDQAKSLTAALEAHRRLSDELAAAEAVLSDEVRAAVAKVESLKASTKKATELLAQLALGVREGDDPLQPVVVRLPEGEVRVTPRLSHLPLYKQILETVYGLVEDKVKRKIDRLKTSERNVLTDTTVEHTVEAPAPADAFAHEGA